MDTIFIPSTLFISVVRSHCGINQFRVELFLPVPHYCEIRPANQKGTLASTFLSKQKTNTDSHTHNSWTHARTYARPTTNHTLHNADFFCFGECYKAVVCIRMNILNISNVIQKLFVTYSMLSRKDPLQFDAWLATSKPRYLAIDNMQNT